MIEDTADRLVWVLGRYAMIISALSGYVVNGREKERGRGLKDRTDLVLLAFAPIIIVNQSNSKKMQSVCGVRMATEDRMESFL